MAGTAWTQWLTAFRTSTPAPTYRQLAGAVEFAVRALDAAKLLDDAPSERAVLEALAWPANLTTDAERAGPRARERLAEKVPLGALAMSLTWLNTSTRVLDDHSVAVGDWATFRGLVDGVGDLTRRLDVLKLPRPTPPATPAPTPTAPSSPAWKPIGPYGAIVNGWQPQYWTRKAAAEGLRWLELQSKRAKLPTEVAYYYTIIADGPDGPLTAGVAAQLVLGYRTLANDLDIAVADGKLTPQKYSEPADAWAYAQKVARAATTTDDDEAPDVEPGTTTRDLPTTPPGGGGTKPPTTSTTPGPYVAAFNRFRTWAATTNGLDTDRSSPRMSREQSAAVLRYIVRQARTHLNADDPATRRWLSIALPLLGWAKRGDKYRSDAAWRTGNTGLPTIAELWSYALDVCRQLDAQGVAFDGPHPAPTTDYMVMMQEAADAQAADDPTMPPPMTPATPPGGGGTIPPAPTPSSVPVPLPVNPPLPTSAPLGGEAALLLVALLAMDAF